MALYHVVVGIILLSAGQSF